MVWTQGNIELLLRFHLHWIFFSIPWTPLGDHHLVDFKCTIICLCLWFLFLYSWYILCTFNYQSHAGNPDLSLHLPSKYLNRHFKISMLKITPVHFIRYILRSKMIYLSETFLDLRADSITCCLLDLGKVT